MNSKPTHCQRLLARLRRAPINPLQAWRELGIYRLGARVFELRRAGHTINRDTVTVRNRYGEACRVARYRLIKAGDA